MRIRVQLSVFAVLLAGASVFSSPSALASGLEKTVGWSGHYAGVAGAAADGVNDSQALFFNPAELAGSGTNVSGNLTFLIPSFSGPIQTANTTVSSQTPLTPLYGAFAAYAVTDKLSIAAGTYISGGTRALFGNPDFTSAGFSGFTPAIKSSLTLTEYSIGGGYEVIDGLKIGAAWRILHAGGSLGTASITSGGATVIANGFDFENISATRYNGFRLGADYSPKGSNWGVGAQWRSEVRFTATTNYTNTSMVILASNGSTLQPSTTSAAAQGTVNAALPQEIQLGGHYDFMPNLRVIAQYDWQQYAVNSVLGFGGVNSYAGGTATAVQNAPLGWNNISIERLAADYGINSNWDVRGGFALTGQSTGSGLAQPIFSSPSTGKTITVGTGYMIASNINLDGSFEYSWASGQGGTPTEVPASQAGTYASHDIVFDLGATYRF